MNVNKLQYITNGGSEVEILDEIQSVVDAGCQWVQLRIKNKDLDFSQIAEKAKKLCMGNAVFIINDRVDIAKKVDADGVHLGLEDLPISEARQILGENKIIGGTANTKVDCINHQRDGADYIGLGPYRPTTTKKKLSPVLGVKGYQSILTDSDSVIRIPVVAIGGIRLEDIEPLKQKTNIYGIAVSGLIAKSSKKQELVREIYAKLN